MAVELPTPSRPLVPMYGCRWVAKRAVVYTLLIPEAGTSRATVITYINPLVAVVLGITLLGEQPGPSALAGLLLILAGSWLSTGGRIPRPPGRSAWPGGHRGEEIERPAASRAARSSGV